MKKNSFVEGTFIATFAIILIKILGALYVIPFYRIIGEDGGALYSYAYNVYNLFLNISTAGLPVAISKIISEYNALEMYETKERAYKICRNVMTIISCIAFFLICSTNNWKHRRWKLNTRHRFLHKKRIILLINNSVFIGDKRIFTRT